MKYLLTCSAGLESLAKKEIQKAGGELGEVFDRLCFCSGDLTLMARLNLESRVGNKLYLVLCEGKVKNFDQLFDLTSQYAWKHLIKHNAEILVKATQVRSQLTSTPVIQKIVKKAIVKSLLPQGSEILREDPKAGSYEIFAFLYEDTGYILLNTSGETLYKRGYRTEAGEAPIKESLASALVSLAFWDFRTPFFDLCCGSGTIAIEAAMMARNIAPGLMRHFAFENYELLSLEDFERIKEELKAKIYDQRYMIIASDLDPEMIRIAEINAKNAGVDDTIRFQLKDVRKYIKEKMTGTLISNPPYGQRLSTDDLKGLYKNFATLLTSNPTLNGGIITSYLEFESMIPWKQFKKRKLYNGNEMCYFFQKNAHVNKGL